MPLLFSAHTFSAALLLSATGLDRANAQGPSPPPAYCDPKVTDPPQFCPGGVPCPDCGTTQCLCPTPGPPPPPASSFICNKTAFVCEEAQGGPFPHLRDCQANCSSPGVKYACNRNKQCQISKEGNFSDLEDCNLDCVQPSNRFSCNQTSGMCAEDPSGSFPHLSDCQASCGQPPAPAPPSPRVCGVAVGDAVTTAVSDGPPSGTRGVVRCAGADNDPTGEVLVCFNDTWGGGHDGNGHCREAMPPCQHDASWWLRCDEITAGGPAPAPSPTPPPSPPPTYGPYCKQPHRPGRNPCAADQSDYCCEFNCDYCGPKTFCEKYSPEHKDSGMCNPSYVPPAGQDICPNYFKLPPCDAEDDVVYLDINGRIVAKP